MAWYNNIFSKKQTTKPVRRVERRITRSFEAAKSKGILKGWTTDDFQSYNGILWSELDSLRARSREAENNSPLAAGFIKSTARGVVGNGFQLRPNTGNKELDEAVIRCFEKQSKAKNWTTQKNMTRMQFEYLLMYQLVRDGEVFIQKVPNAKNETGYSLRLLDASQVFTQYVGGGNYVNAAGVVVGSGNTLGKSIVDKNTGNRIVLGVEIDADFAPVAYHIRSGNHNNNLSSTFTYHASDTMRIPAEQMIHIFIPTYSNQVRGVPWTHAALEDLELLRRYNFVAMNAARLGAAKAMTIESQEGAGFSGDSVDTEDQSEFQINMEGNDVSQLPQGTKLVFHDSKYPHEMYEQFVNRIQQILATALDTNSAIMFGNFKDINFSAGQIALLDMREKYKALQKIITERLYDELFPEYMKHTIMMGKLEDKDGNPMLASNTLVDICTANCQFRGKQFSPVDMGKAATANKTLVETGVKSRAQVIRESGEEPDDVFAEIEKERELFPPEVKKEEIDVENDDKDDDKKDEDKKEKDDEND